MSSFDVQADFDDPTPMQTASERARQFGEAMCENLKHNVGELRKSGAWMGIETQIPQSTGEKRLEDALREILGRFPSDEVIEAIMADKGLGYRFCPMDPMPRDSDVVRWRTALEK